MAAAVTGPDVPGTLTVISVRRAEADPARSVVATVEAGRTLLVTNFDSGQVEMVNVAGLP
ncbi:MAG TPA: hypothetical protein VLL69_01305 [Streptosporangiaceae bacterium]|nr:hypothetical protein [Streptosporangiaceae bacterium]